MAAFSTPLPSERTFVRVYILCYSANDIRSDIGSAISLRVNNNGYKLVDSLYDKPILNICG